MKTAVVLFTRDLRIRGCLSAATAVDDPGGAFVRQLCWRDVYHQVALAFPDLSTVAYRRGVREDWRYDPEALARWQEGSTGNDTRPYRRFNPQRQAERYDPEGEYVNRYAPR